METKKLHPPYTGTPIPPVDEGKIDQAKSFILTLLEERLNSGHLVIGKFISINIQLQQLERFSYPTLAHAMLQVANEGWSVSFVHGAKRTKASFQFTNYKQSHLYADMLAFQKVSDKKSFV